MQAKPNDPLMAISDDALLYNKCIPVSADSLESSATDVPASFVPISGAVTKLQLGMFGALKRAKAIADLKVGKCRDLSVGWEGRRTLAAKRIRRAAMRGEFAVFVTTTGEPMLLSGDVVARIIPVRGGLPDRAARVHCRPDGPERLLRPVLARGVLVVRSDQFGLWYQAEKAKRSWPSQRAQRQGRAGSPRPRGRPARMTEAIRNVILGYVNEHRWNGGMGNAALRRLLLRDMPETTLSEDTLARWVDAYYQETGDAGFRVRKRRKRSPR